VLTLENSYRCDIFRTRLQWDLASYQVVAPSSGHGARFAQTSVSCDVMLGSCDLMQLADIIVTILCGLCFILSNAGVALTLLFL